MAVLCIKLPFPPDRLQLPIWGPRCRGNWMSPLKKKMGVKARFRSVQPLSRFWRVRARYVIKAPWASLHQPPTTTLTTHSSGRERFHGAGWAISLYTAARSLPPTTTRRWPAESALTWIALAPSPLMSHGQRPIYAMTMKASSVASAIAQTILSASRKRAVR